MHFLDKKSQPYVEMTPAERIQSLHNRVPVPAQNPVEQSVWLSRRVGLMPPTKQLAAEAFSNVTTINFNEYMAANPSVGPIVITGVSASAMTLVQGGRTGLLRITYLQAPLAKLKDYVTGIVYVNNSNAPFIAYPGLSVSPSGAFVGL